MVEFNLRGRVVWSRVVTQNSICTINGDEMTVCFADCKFLHTESPQD